MTGELYGKEGKKIRHPGWKGCGARKIADLALDKDDEWLAKHAAREALVEDVKGERPEKGRHIEQGELSALIQACTSDPSLDRTRPPSMTAGRKQPGELL